ncbi:MAG: hypothetical protein COB16_16425 [Rhodobacteraceae bacterium]|nr:MAG: hypothetical protein COB16_16425 [Paracoccaceae bacterium]
MSRARYTTQLQAGLGLVNETKALLELWSPGMTSSRLFKIALESGRFPGVTARRLRNIVSECFAPRYLVSDGEPAHYLQKLSKSLSTAEQIQLMFIFTSRANPILGDFVRDVFWARYAGGYQEISNEDARVFVERGIDDGKTSKRWSESTIRRISAYLTGCCADYGLLERGSKSRRKMLPFRISPSIAAYLAYELHFQGNGDNAVLNHKDWHLFGLDRDDVAEEMKRLSLNGLLIIQSAGEVVRISWKQNNMEELCDVLTQG